MLPVYATALLLSASQGTPEWRIVSEVVRGDMLIKQHAESMWHSRLFGRMHSMFAAQKMLVKIKQLKAEGQHERAAELHTVVEYYRRIAADE